MVSLNKTAHYLIVSAHQLMHTELFFFKLIALPKTFLTKLDSNNHPQKNNNFTIILYIIRKTKLVFAKSSCV
jgi:hypothetical protein